MESCKNGKIGKRRFHPQLLDFDQEESHFRDFHQILGKTVVFKAKFEKFGKLQKWENAVLTLNYWILIRKNHIFVIFIKFWVRQSCLKQNSKSLESCKKWENGETPFSPSIIGFWSGRIIFSWFSSNSGSDSRVYHINWESCKTGKNGKRQFHPQILDFGQNGSHFRGFRQILDKTVVFKAEFEKFGKLQK